MADDEAATTFADLALREELLAALTHLGYEEPTPIQREAIPPLIDGRDLLGQAATGTGKTAAFALPVLQRLERDRTTTDPASLVLVPTRELSMQVSEAMHKYGRGLGARVASAVVQYAIDLEVPTIVLNVSHENEGARRVYERLGFRRWKALHRLAYVAGGLAIVHFVWRFKTALLEPLIAGAVLFALLGIRLVARRAPARFGAKARAG